MNGTVALRWPLRPALFVLVGTFVLGSWPLARAEVAVPSIIGDHMVLQRGAEAPIWGWANPGEKVMVTIGDQTQQTTADEQGKWMVRLQPLEVSEPRTHDD